MLLYHAVSHLCTAKQPDTVILVSHSSPFQPGMFLHPWLFWYSGTPWCWDSCFESCSQRHYQLLFGWWQCKSELNVLSTGKNSSRMLQVSLTQPELKAPKPVKPSSWTERGPTLGFYSVALRFREGEESSGLLWWRSQGFHFVSKNVSSGNSSEITRRYSRA